jgi:predicted amidohydrolase
LAIHKRKVKQIVVLHDDLYILDDVNYNSVCFVNPVGKLLTTYQKSFLFETDDNWAIEGPGFVSKNIEELGQVYI